MPARAQDATTPGHDPPGTPRSPVDEMDEVDLVDTDLRIPCPSRPCSPPRPLFRPLRGWIGGNPPVPAAHAAGYPLPPPSGLEIGSPHRPRRLTPPASLLRRFAAADWPLREGPRPPEQAARLQTGSGAPLVIRRTADITRHAALSPPFAHRAWRRTRPACGQGRGMSRGDWSGCALRARAALGSRLPPCPAC